MKLLFSVFLLLRTSSAFETIEQQLRGDKDKKADNAMNMGSSEFLPVSDSESIALSKGIESFDPKDTKSSELVLEKTVLLDDDGCDSQGMYSSPYEDGVCIPAHDCEYVEDDICVPKDYESRDPQVKILRKKYNKRQVQRTKEELVKIAPNACMPDILLWPDSPEAECCGRTCFFGCGGYCDNMWPFTQSSSSGWFGQHQQCEMPKVPECTGDDRYFYTPPAYWILVPEPYDVFLFPGGNPIKTSYEWFIGDQANPACRSHCGGYFDSWCPSIVGLGLPYCTMDTGDCVDLNWEQFSSVVMFISNFFPATKVLKVMQKAKTISNASRRAAFIRAGLKQVAKRQLLKLKKKAKKAVRQAIRDVAEDLKDELMEEAMVALAIEEANKEDSSVFSTEYALNVVETIDIIGVFDLVNAFWKQECSYLEPEEIKPGDDANCANTAGATSSPLGVEDYWNSHDWEQVCMDHTPYWRRLGYNKRKWNGPIYGHSRSEFTAWNRLDDNEKTAAEALGYSSKTWDAAQVPIDS